MLTLRGNEQGSPNAEISELPECDNAVHRNDLSIRA